MFITIQNFSNTYLEQPFMQGLRDSAQCLEQSAKQEHAKQTHWLDCTRIAGTDCYCDDEAVKEINKLIDESGTAAENEGCGTAAGIHFFDNGNYHYMSKIWTDRVTKPFDLVVFDHHPDMQPPRFGDILSCGGWVKKVLEENKFVQNVVIIGVADHLIEELQADETAEFANYKDRVTFIPESEIREWQKSERTTSHLSSNIYFSIDKDVFSPSEAATNWDQGSLTFETLKSIITELAQGHKILGIDICGERAQEFCAIENGAQTAQEADELNNKLNQELVEFLRCEV